MSLSLKTLIIEVRHKSVLFSQVPSFSLTITTFWLFLEPVLPPIKLSLLFQMWFELDLWISGGSSGGVSDPEGFTRRRFTDRPSIAACPRSRTRAWRLSTAASCLPSWGWDPGTSSSSSSTSSSRRGTFPRSRARDIPSSVNCCRRKCSALTHAGDVVTTDFSSPHHPDNQGSPTKLWNAQPWGQLESVFYPHSLLAIVVNWTLRYLNGLQEFIQWSLKLIMTTRWSRSF